MKFKGAIFDLDGVVVDTVPLHFSAWKRMFEEHGKKFNFEDYKQKVDGIPRYDGARAILTDLPEDRLKKTADKKQGYFMELLGKEKIPKYETTIKLIESLKKTSIKVAVISSSKNCSMILKKIGLYDKLDAVVSGNDITKGKPDPQIFLTAADKIGVSPDSCVVFEDAVLGVEAAKRGRMKCVGIDRYKNPSRLKGADLIVADLGEVDIKTLNKLF